MNKKRFVRFIKTALVPRLEADQLLVLDDLRPHWSTQAIAAIEAAGAHVLWRDAFVGTGFVRPARIFNSGCWAAVASR